MKPIALFWINASVGNPKGNLSTIHAEWNVKVPRSPIVVWIVFISDKFQHLSTENVVNIPHFFLTANTVAELYLIVILSGVEGWIIV